LNPQYAQSLGTVLTLFRFHCPLDQSFERGTLLFSNLADAENSRVISGPLAESGASITVNQGTGVAYQQFGQTAIAAGDLNGDQLVDLVTVNVISNTVHILLRQAGETQGKATVQNGSLLSALSPSILRFSTRDTETLLLSCP